MFHPISFSSAADRKLHGGFPPLSFLPFSPRDRSFPLFWECLVSWSLLVLWRNSGFCSFFGIFPPHMVTLALVSLPTFLGVFFLKR